MSQKFIRCGQWSVTSSSPSGEEIGISVLTVACDFDDEFEVYSYPYLGELIDRDLFLVTGNVTGEGYDGEDILDASSIQVVGKVRHIEKNMFSLVKE